MFAFLLHPEREKSLLRRHPWVFSKAIASVLKLSKQQAAAPQLSAETLADASLQVKRSEVEAGELCQVRDSRGNFLAWCHFSPYSQIILRVISFELEARIDRQFFLERLKSAIEKRRTLQNAGNDGLRLVAAEGDYLPGLIVDRYNNVLSFAITSWGMEANYEHIVSALHELQPECYIYERSDGKTRPKEKLLLRRGAVDYTDARITYNLCNSDGTPLPASKQITEVPALPSSGADGAAACDCAKVPVSEAIPATLYVKENDLVSIPIDVKDGHKTGGYLDQRQSRLHTYELCREFKALHGVGPSVLNCFSYTGGFGLLALKGGASKVFNIDVSAHALEAAKQGVVWNHLDPGRCKFIKKDVFSYLREEVQKGTKFDVVILDPPKFAESKSTLVTACRGYQDINRLGLQLVKKGGHLLTFSCSGLMSEELLQKIIADAALDAKVDAQIVATLRQDRDHVVSLPCPESFYLKGFDLIVN